MAPLLERFDDLAAEPAIAAEVAARAATIHSRRGSQALALEWADHALEIAEAHGLIDIVVDALATKGTMLVTAGRNIESGVLLAGAARLAHQNGTFDAELRARALLVNSLLDDDPRGALVESRDAAAVARGLGRSAWTVLLNGTAAEAALAAGDWPDARQWLDEPLTVDPEARELVITHALRALHAALAGHDPAADLAALEELRATGVGQADASMTFYYDATAGYLAGLAGDHRLAHDVAVACAARDPLNEYYLRERATRAALWLGDARLARAQIDLLRALGYRGRANRTSLHTVEAGLAALEGRRGHAIPAYRDAMAEWRDLSCDGGLAFTLLDTGPPARAGDRRGTRGRGGAAAPARAARGAGAPGDPGRPGSPYPRARLIVGRLRGIGTARASPGPSSVAGRRRDAEGLPAALERGEARLDLEVVGRVVEAGELGVERARGDLGHAARLGLLVADLLLEARDLGGRVHDVDALHRLGDLRLGARPSSSARSARPSSGPAPRAWRASR